MVERLACFMSPKHAAEALRDECGVEIAPQSVEGYDPTKRAGAKLAKKWVDLFWFTRKAFVKHIEDHIPGANKAVRLARLERAVVAFEAKGNYVGMADMTERQAKEMGNVHTNRREFTGKDAGPIKYQDVTDMTDEQIDQELERLLTQSGLALVPIN